jgi:hypothetical protein
LGREGGFFQGVADVCEVDSAGEVGDSQGKLLMAEDGAVVNFSDALAEDID